MRINNNDLVLSSTDMSANLQSNPIWLGHIEHFSIQLVFTGTPNGSFKLQASLDDGGIDVSSPSVTNWTDVANSSQAITAAGDHLYTVQNASYKWVRLVWTFSSGSGTITSSRFNVKGS
jgi:hypothetical protein